MRKPYQFNKIGHPENSWGMDAENLVWESIQYQYFTDQRDCTNRGIESQIAQISLIIGRLSDKLISKGLLSPQGLLEAVDLNFDFEVRETKDK
jgi:hypothetical protein